MYLNLHKCVYVAVISPIKNVALLIGGLEFITDEHKQNELKYCELAPLNDTRNECQCGRPLGQLVHVQIMNWL